VKKIEEQQRGEARSDEIPGSLGLLADLLRTRPEDAPLFDVFWREEARSRVVPAEAVLEGIPDGLKGAYLLLPAAGRPGIPPDILARPGVIGLLKSRLEADPRIKDRLAGLEDAVIVADIKEGVRLWLEHRELNYLTPAGDLLLSSGLLKLGEKAGGMIALASEIRSLEELGSRLETEMAPLAARLEAAGHEKAAIDASLDEATASQLREERAARDAAKELHFIRTEADKIRAAHDLLGRELEILRAEKDALVRNLKKTTEFVSGREEEARALKARAEAGERGLAESAARAAEAERGFLALEAGLALLQEKTNGLRRQMETTAGRKAALEAKITQIGEDTRRGEEEKARLRETIQGLKDSVGNLSAERNRSETALADAESRLQKIRTGLEESETAVQEARREEESAKDERVRHEIRKAEVERDLVNLDEMCWQELKKTLVELKAEAQESPSVPAAPAPAGDADIEDSDETGEEPAEALEAGADEAAEPGPEAEAARPRRTRKVRRPVTEMSDDDVEQELEETRESLNRFKAVNLMAEEEFLEQRKRYDFLVEQRRDLRESIASTEEAIRRIDEESKVQFLKALGEVNTNFQQIFTVLFKGGNAEVKLLEPDNPLESGVEIVAQPPGKRVQNLSLLSGGEKSLTSLSFLFALFRYRPSPFCFLDEVDAALDDVNLTRFLDLLNTIKHQTQFILITHNYKTMEVADYIYGTTMSEPNMTKLLSVKLEKKGGGEILNNIS
jgi:chromosome segregation protein